MRLNPPTYFPSHHPFAFHSLHFCREGLNQWHGGLTRVWAQVLAIGSVQCSGVQEVFRI